MRDTDCDVLVIGSGAGGGTLAARCAERGLSVIVLERGRAVGLPSGRPAGEVEEQRTLVEKEPYDDREILLQGRPQRLYTGGMAGGGTSLYGAALVRPRESDFQPGRYYSGKIPECIHEWPLEFSEFLPWLMEAERLYRVADAPGSGSTGSSDTAAGLPLARISEQLLRAAEGLGHRPWRLPLAIDANRCLRCSHCAGFECPTGARRSSEDLLRSCELAGQPLRRLLHCEAQRIERSGNQRIDAVRVLDRRTGQEFRLRAKRYVLAAGATGSAALLIRSGFEHSLIGRNYMLHCSPLVVGIFSGRTGADETFIKQVGLDDFYLGTDEVPEKMGLIQSLPAPGVAMLRKYGLRYAPAWLLRWLRARLLPLVGIIEDLPDPANRVQVESDGRIRLDHRYGEFDLLRARAQAREMVRLLKHTGAALCVRGKLASSEHAAHQCGTLRFGTDVRTAVLDSDCRMFDYPELFVADGSFMPTSLGVGPSLTIIANALRVAEIVLGECGMRVSVELAGALK
ncbi:MAG: FAD-dependent oxidoreductase [Planctomycetaceae bacterium]